MKKVAQFYKVSYKQFKEGYKKCFGFIPPEENIKEMYDNIKLPKRATSGSVGHDIATPVDITIVYGRDVMIPTGLRCEISDGYGMLIFPRSSLGIKKKMSISNTIPVIDSDYFDADNEGHIFLSLKNSKNEALVLNRGDNIVQALFVQCGVADEEIISQKRIGGIGSTGA